MDEIYWITRLDNIQGAFIGVLVISVVFICIILTGNSDVYGFEESMEIALEKHNKMLRVLACSTIISITVLLFVPNSKDALIIYGLGGTMEYLQSNKTAQGLPDKFTQALDKYLDKELKDEKEDKE